MGFSQLRQSIPLVGNIEVPRYLLHALCDLVCFVFMCCAAGDNWSIDHGTGFYILEVQAEGREVALKGGGGWRAGTPQDPILAVSTHYTDCVLCGRCPGLLHQGCWHCKCFTHGVLILSRALCSVVQVFGYIGALVLSNVFFILPGYFTIRANKIAPASKQSKYRNNKGYLM